MSELSAEQKKQLVIYLLVAKSFIEVEEDASIIIPCKLFLAIASRLDELESTVSALTAENKAKDKYIESLESDLRRNRRECDAAVGSIASVTDLANTYARENSIEEAESVSGIKPLIDRFGFAFTTLRMERGALTAENKELKKRAVELELIRQEEDKEYAAQLAELRSTAARLEKELEEAKGSLSRAYDERITYDAQLKALAATVARLTVEYSSLCPDCAGHSPVPIGSTKYPRGVLQNDKCSNSHCVNGRVWIETVKGIEGVMTEYAGTTEAEEGSENWIWVGACRRILRKEGK